MAAKKEIGKKIARLRKSRGWNQKELGQRCGYGNDAQSRISHYERGVRAVSFEEAGVISDALGVDLHEIVESKKSREDRNPLDTELLSLIRSTSPDQKAALLLLLRSMNPTYVSN